MNTLMTNTDANLFNKNPSKSSCGQNNYNNKTKQNETTTTKPRHLIDSVSRLIT